MITLTGCLADDSAVFSARSVEVAGYKRHWFVYKDTWVVFSLFLLAILTLAEVIGDKGGNERQPLIPQTAPHSSLCRSCSVTETAISPSKTRCVDVVLG